MLSRFKIRPFTLVVLFSGLFLAGITAIFSVFGISSLYKGSRLFAGLMAGGLEISKLTMASYLKRQWNDLDRFIKYYVIPVVAILIIITSMGVYGFLINAFQGNLLEYNMLRGNLALITEKVESTNSLLNTYKEEKIAARQNLQYELTQMKMDSSSRYLDSKHRQRIYDRWMPDVDRYDSLLSINQIKLDSLKIKKLELDQKIATIGVEIGPMTFVADLIPGNVDLPFLVNIITFILVFVCDPTAVVLIIIFNELQQKDKEYFDNLKKSSPKKSSANGETPKKRTYKKRKSAKKITQKKSTPKEGLVEKSIDEPNEIIETSEEKSVTLNAVLDELGAAGKKVKSPHRGNNSPISNTA